jgi:hypothetical protein
LDGKQKHIDNHEFFRKIPFLHASIMMDSTGSIVAFSSGLSCSVGVDIPEANHFNPVQFQDKLMK